MKILIFFFMFLGLHQGLGFDHEALGNESLNFFISYFGLYQGLGPIMKHLVTGAWILGLWVEAAPIS
jgi:hypothetical protein